MGRRQCVQNEVYVVAEEGADDEREDEPCEGEEEHVHRRDFILRAH